MADNQTVYGIGELNTRVKALLDATPALGNVFVRGEISNYKGPHPTGHMYFSLKDADGVISAVMFRDSVYRLNFRPDNGMKVVAHGRVSLFPKSGTYQIYIDHMAPDGLGSLYAAYLKLKEKLENEGLFDPSHKRKLPKFPSAVGVVTSPTGAAIQDMLKTIAKRYPLAQVNLYPALVQGPGAPADLLAGIRFFGNHPELADVIIIGRGGGSIEDLWAFNDEALARAIYACPIPVVSAVGHETDFTICDFVADLRVPTPTAGAVAVVPDRLELLNLLSGWRRGLEGLVLQDLKKRAADLDRLQKRRVMQSPLEPLNEKRMQLDYAVQRLARTGEVYLGERRTRLRALEAGLKAMSPLAVLDRGYSILTDEDGKSVGSAEDLEIGQTVRVRLRDGSAGAEIREIKRKEEESDESEG